jgi:adenylosuccinate synthase
VPVYEDRPGWSETTVGLRSEGDLPVNARAYIDRLESLLDTAIDLISTGPDREETIVRRLPF